MLQRIKNHVLVQTFVELKGNPKWAIIAQTLFSIPYSLILPFQTLYMRKLGLTSLEIGTTLTVGFVMQMLCALFGGIITDKLGRRKTTVIFDTLGWAVACTIWAFSQNFVWFLIAACVNAFFQVTNISWYCLFIEDCPPKYVTNAFTLIQMCGMISVFFAPISVALVARYDLVPVMRCLYLIAAVMMQTRFFLLYHFSKETPIGKQRMAETSNQSYFSMLKGYAAVLVQMLRSSQMRLVVCFITLFNIMQIATNNFYSLFVTERIRISDEIVAVFPMIRTLVMLVFVVGLQRILQQHRMRRVLLLGFGLYIASHLVLLATPAKNLWMLMIYTILEASAYAIIFPRKDALMAYYVDPQERSRIYALCGVLMVGLTSPFGSLVGWLYELNAAWPFVFNLLLFALAILLSASSKDLAHLEEQVTA